MLIRQDQTSPVQSAAIVDQVIIDGCEHINIQSGQIKTGQTFSTLICLIKIPVLSFRNGISLTSFLLLLLLISQMIGCADLCHIIHGLRPKLHLHITSGAVIVKCNM